MKVGDVDLEKLMHMVAESKAARGAYRAMDYQMRYIITKVRIAESILTAARTNGNLSKPRHMSPPPRHAGSQPVVEPARDYSAAIEKAASDLELVQKQQRLASESMATLGQRNTNLAEVLRSINRALKAENITLDLLEDF